MSQMLTRTSLAPTRNTTGAYSTPRVGVVFSFFLPTMKLSSEVLPTFKLPIRMTSCGPKYSGSRCSSNYSFNYTIHTHLTATSKTNLKTNLTSPPSNSQSTQGLDSPPIKQSCPVRNVKIINIKSTPKSSTLWLCNSLPLLFGVLEEIAEQGDDCLRVLAN